MRCPLATPKVSYVVGAAPVYHFFPCVRNEQHQAEFALSDKASEGIMKAIVSDFQKGRPLGGGLARAASSLFPTAFVAVGGLLTVAWVCTLGLYAYRASCWIIG